MLERARVGATQNTNMSEFREKVDGTMVDRTI